MVDPGPHKPEVVAFQFGGDIVVDVRRRELSVGGRSIPCQPLVFQLLVVLCERAGRVVSRQDLFRELWPDQVVVSDESLTRLVSRLRAALGAGGAMVRTARKVGVLLDGEVFAVREDTASGELSRSPVDPDEALSSPTARPAPDLEPAEPAFSPSAQRAAARRRRLRAAILGLAALLVVALTIFAIRSSAGRDAVIDEGFGLRASDLGSSSADTEKLLRLALSLVGLGNHERALVLLQAAYESEPGSPIPAAFLAIAGRSAWDAKASRGWADRAEARLVAGSTPYSRLLVEYAKRAASDQDLEIIASLSALLDLRPTAWRFRLYRAHLHLIRREETAALADIRGIPELPLTVGHNAIAVADRASLGDLDAAEETLARVAASPESRRSLIAYVRGRIAISRERYEEAIRELDQSSEESARESRADVTTDDQILGAVARFELGRFAESLALFDRARADSAVNGEQEHTAAIGGLASYVALRMGDREGAQRRLTEAFASIPDRVAIMRLHLILRALATGLEPPGDPEAIAAAAASDPFASGASSLLHARLALRSGNPAAAKELLGEARRDGVDRLFFREEAALLDSDLGESVAPPKVDPPYPLPLRFAVRWELQHRAAPR